MKKVMVFGIFDGLHDGHRVILKQAKSYGDYLIVVVAQDHMVEHLRGSSPKKSLTERFEHLQKVDQVDKVVIGDVEPSTWYIVKRHRPDVIAISQDQHLLKKDLELHINLKRFGYKPKLVILHPTGAEHNK